MLSLISKLQVANPWDPTGAAGSNCGRTLSGLQSLCISACHKTCPCIRKAATTTTTVAAATASNNRTGRTKEGPLKRDCFVLRALGAEASQRRMLDLLEDSHRQLHKQNYHDYSTRFWYGLFHYYVLLPGHWFRRGHDLRSHPS